jgi:hypothetical protein
MSQNKKPQKREKSVTVDGLPNNAPFEVSEKKRQEIRNKLEKVYGEVLKKKSDKN